MVGCGAQGSRGKRTTPSRERLPRSIQLRRRPLRLTDRDGTQPVTGRSSRSKWAGGPVLAYAIVISLMTVSAPASGNLVAAAGRLPFLLSALTFAWYTLPNP